MNDIHVERRRRLTSLVYLDGIFLVNIATVIATIISHAAGMRYRNINLKVIYNIYKISLNIDISVYFYSIYINLFFNLPFWSFQYQIKKIKICKFSFVFLFTCFKIQDFLIGISLLVVSLFGKQINRLFSCSVLCFTAKNQ